MYLWRKMSAEEREEALDWRRCHSRPWHSPPHLESGPGLYLVTAACFEHAAIIGKSPQRLSDFSEELVSCLSGCSESLQAWVVLPNHYHAVVLSDEIMPVLRELGQLHGRTSHRWNGEDDERGRKVWCNALERVLRSDAHHWATLNYVHHNAVKHGYAERWEEWPWSSASDFIEDVGRDEARELWERFPIKNYGRGWDW